jgi:hypothetical protein
MMSPRMRPLATLAVCANALKRLHIAPLYYTDKVPANKTQEG